MSDEQVDDVGEIDPISALQLIAAQQTALNDQLALLSRKIMPEEPSPPKKSGNRRRVELPGVTKRCSRCNKLHNLSTKQCRECLDFRNEQRRVIMQEKKVSKGTYLSHVAVTFHCSREDLENLGFVLPSKPGQRLHIHLNNGVLSPHPPISDDKPFVTKPRGSSLDDCDDCE